jgi:hypothetical protein
MASFISSGVVWALNSMIRTATLSSLQFSFFTEAQQQALQKKSNFHLR